MKRMKRLMSVFAAALLSSAAAVPAIADSVDLKPGFVSETRIGGLLRLELATLAAEETEKTTQSSIRARVRLDRLGGCLLRPVG